MKHIIALLLIAFVGSSAFSQNTPYQSVSLRLGVPVGITYKVYTGKREAFEFGIGSSAPVWGKHYYINAFNDISRYENFKYIDHTVKNTLFLQGRYLKDFNIPTTGMAGQLGWYCGAGAVLKIARVEYVFTNPEANPPTQRDSRNDIDFGPEAIIGAEYWLADTPFSFYGEGSLMLEVFDRVTGRGFAAIGVRYHFFQ